jgi:hypothetical protein
MNTMRWLFIGILLFIQHVPWAQYTAQPVTATGEVDPCAVENQSFQGGEKLTYTIYFNWNFVWLPAGEVTFKVTDQGEAWKCSAVGHTYSSYEWFVKVNDKLETLIDKKTLHPVYSIREIQEGRYRHYEKIEFDQEGKRTRVFTGKNAKDATLQEKSVSGCVQDVLSVFYYARNFKAEGVSKGHQFPVRVYIDAEEFPLSLTYQGRFVNYNVRNMGKFKVMKFAPQVIEGGIFEKDTDMKLWISDDGNKIPVQMETPMKVGNIKVVLKKYEGLRYAFDAKTK